MWLIRPRLWDYRVWPRRVSASVDRDWFKIKSTEFAASRLEDNFLAFDCGPGRVSSLIGDLTEDVLHHLYLAIVIDRRLFIEFVIHRWLTMMRQDFHILFDINLLDRPRYQHISLAQYFRR